MIDSYNEVLKSIENIVKNVANKMGFDKTVLGVVTKRFDNSLGNYIVKIDNVEFEAISTLINLKVGDYVYITIPNGDYSETKIISGKKNTEQEETDINPRDQIISLNEISIDEKKDISFDFNENDNNCVKDIAILYPEWVNLVYNTYYKKEDKEENILDKIQQRLNDNSKYRDARVRFELGDDGLYNKRLILPEISLIGDIQIECLKSGYQFAIFERKEIDGEDSQYWFYYNDSSDNLLKKSNEPKDEIYWLNSETIYTLLNKKQTIYNIYLKKEDNSNFAIKEDFSELFKISPIEEEKEIDESWKEIEYFPLDLENQRYQKCYLRCDFISNILATTGSYSINIDFISKNEEIISNVILPHTLITGEPYNSIVPITIEDCFDTPLDLLVNNFKDLYKIEIKFIFDNNFYDDFVNDFTKQNIKNGSVKIQNLKFILGFDAINYSGEDIIDIYPVQDKVFPGYINTPFIPKMTNFYYDNTLEGTSIGLEILKYNNNQKKIERITSFDSEDNIKIGWYEYILGTAPNNKNLNNEKNDLLKELNWRETELDILGINNLIFNFYEYRYLDIESEAEAKGKRLIIQDIPNDFFRGINILPGYKFAIFKSNKNNRNFLKLENFDDDGDFLIPNNKSWIVATSYENIPWLLTQEKFYDIRIEPTETYNIYIKKENDKDFPLDLEENIIISNNSNNFFTKFIGNNKSIDTALIQDRKHPSNLSFNLIHNFKFQKQVQNSQLQVKARINNRIITSNTLKYINSDEGLLIEKFENEDYLYVNDNYNGFYNIYNIDKTIIESFNKEERVIQLTNPNVNINNWYIINLKGEKIKCNNETILKNNIINTNIKPIKITDNKQQLFFKLNNNITVNNVEYICCSYEDINKENYKIESLKNYINSKNKYRKFQISKIEDFNSDSSSEKSYDRLVLTVPAFEGKIKIKLKNENYRFAILKHLNENDNDFYQFLEDDNNCNLILDNEISNFSSKGWLEFNKEYNFYSEENIEYQIYLKRTDDLDINLNSDLEDLFELNSNTIFKYYPIICGFFNTDGSPYNFSLMINQSYGTRTFPALVLNWEDQYNKTSDKEIILGKKYYIKNNGIYEIVTNPEKNEIGLYYEKNEQLKEDYIEIIPQIFNKEGYNIIENISDNIHWNLITCEDGIIKDNILYDLIKIKTNDNKLVKTYEGSSTVPIKLCLNFKDYNIKSFQKDSFLQSLCDQGNYTILEATVNYNNYNLKAFLPIGLTTNKYFLFSGPFYLNYTSENEFSFDYSNFSFQQLNFNKQNFCLQQPEYKKINIDKESFKLEEDELILEQLNNNTNFFIELNKFNGIDDYLINLTGEYIKIKKNGGLISISDDTSSQVLEDNLDDISFQDLKNNLQESDQFYLKIPIKITCPKIFDIIDNNIKIEEDPGNTLKNKEINGLSNFLFLNDSFNFKQLILYYIKNSNKIDTSIDINEEHKPIYNFFIEILNNNSNDDLINNINQILRQIYYSLLNEYDLNYISIEKVDDNFILKYGEETNQKLEFRFKTSEEVDENSFILLNNSDDIIKILNTSINNFLEAFYLKNTNEKITFFTFENLFYNFIDNISEETLFEYCNEGVISEIFTSLNNNKPSSIDYLGNDFLNYKMSEDILKNLSLRSIEKDNPDKPKINNGTIIAKYKAKSISYINIKTLFIEKEFLKYGLNNFLKYNWGKGWEIKEIFPSNINIYFQIHLNIILGNKDYNSFIEIIKSYLSKNLELKFDWELNLTESQKISILKISDENKIYNGSFLKNKNIKFSICPSEILNMPNDLLSKTEIKITYLQFLKNSLKIDTFYQNFMGLLGLSLTKDNLNYYFDEANNKIINKIDYNIDYKNNKYCINYSPNDLFNFLRLYRLSEHKQDKNYWKKLDELTAIFPYQEGLYQSESWGSLFPKEDFYLNVDSNNLFYAGRGLSFNKNDNIVINAKKLLKNNIYTLWTSAEFDEDNNFIDKFKFKVNNVLIDDWIDNIFIIPIIGLMNYYPMSLINEWDSVTSIKNEENGYILSSQGIFGQKNNNKHFSGTIIEKPSMNNIKTDLNPLESGLYGFINGEKKYSLTNNGTLILGNEKQNQLIFNGDNGKISTGNYNLKESGSLLDLSTGLLESPNFKLKSKNIQINSNVEDNYLTITNDKTKNILNIGNTDYTLMNSNFNNYQKSGGYINLDKGQMVTQNGFILVESSTIDYIPSNFYKALYWYQQIDNNGFQFEINNDIISYEITTEITNLKTNNIFLEGNFMNYWGKNEFSSNTNTSCSNDKIFDDETLFTVDYISEIENNKQENSGNNNTDSFPQEFNPFYGAEGQWGINNKAPWGADAGEEKLSFKQNNEKKCFNYFKNMGFSIAVICGILSNIEAESEYDSTCIYYENDAEGNYGYGIFQWTYITRRQGLFNFAGTTEPSIEMQLAYAEYELKNNSFFKSLYNKLKELSAQANTEDIAYQAGSQWCEIYEIPADGGYQAKRRGNHAKKIFNYYINQL